MSMALQSSQKRGSAWEGKGTSPSSPVLTLELCVYAGDVAGGHMRGAVPHGHSGAASSGFSACEEWKAGLVAGMLRLLGQLGLLALTCHTS